MIGTASLAATLLEDVGHPLAPCAGDITIDDGWAPHVQASLTVPIPAEDVQELIDARESRRIEIEGTAFTPFGTTSLTADLGLRAREIDHLAGTITLTLESDEALLMDDVLLTDTPDTSAFAYQSSVRDIINNVVLSRIGATLEPSAVDAPFVVLWDARNEMPNPTVRTAVGNWIAGGANGTLVRMTGLVGSPVPGVTTYTRSTWTAPSGFNVGGAYARSDEVQPFMSVKEGSSYRVSAWVRTAHPKTVDVCMQFYSSNGGRVRSVRSTKYRLVANVWTLVSAVITAPVTAARAAPFIYEANAEQFGQGNIFDTMAWMCYEDKPGALALDYFDGATASTTEYAYAWTGDPNASSSIRTALTDRSPDALTWQPGRSAWEFIQPIFQAVGLRLFCDEARRWWLVDAGHVHDGHVQLSAPGNLIRARDDISRSSDDWYDAALFEYRWMDSTATSQIAFDWYAEPGHTRVRHFLVEHAYPGAGAAEYAVKRAQGKGRALDLTAVTRYSVRPSQPVTASLPGTPIQSGLVARVTFDLGLNEMTLTTRGLTDTPADAYIFGDPSIRYLDVPPGMTYNTFDWSVL